MARKYHGVRLFADGSHFTPEAGARLSPWTPPPAVERSRQSVSRPPVSSTCRSIPPTTVLTNRTEAPAPA